MGGPWQRDGRKTHWIAFTEEDWRALGAWGRLHQMTANRFVALLARHYLKNRPELSLTPERRSFEDMLIDEHDK